MVDGAALEISPRVYWLDLGGTNVYFIGDASAWVLVDCGWKKDRDAIVAAAQSLFGDLPPVAIVLTHAHPDHIGDADRLAAGWQVKILLHPDEMPIVTGDILEIGHLLDTFGNWFIALKPVLPEKWKEAMRRDARLTQAVPLDPEKGIPGIPGWQVVHTPGHTPGHISLFRPSDRTLIAGDACLTQPFETWTNLAMHRFSHPQRLSLPFPLSCWNKELTKRSVATLAALEPWLMASGHGDPIAGPDLAAELKAFAERCERIEY